MLRQFISPKHFLLYLSFIALTWLEAVISPTLVAMIVSSFEKQTLDALWLALAVGILGNVVILVGLAGKRYYYARLVADFTLGMKNRLFEHFLYDKSGDNSDILSQLEHDVKQLESTYLEPAVIILSLLGFSVVSMIYALATHFWLGLLFIGCYAIPALCSGIGSQRLNRISEEKARSHQQYLAQVTSIIGGGRVLKHYGAMTFFMMRFKDVLSQRVNQDIRYEQQRTLNSMIIHTIDAFCSVLPLIVGGVMTYYYGLSAASFVAIYLLSHHIGYQFNDLSYFINTYQSSQQLRSRYACLLQNRPSQSSRQEAVSLFPIRCEGISVCFEGKPLFEDLSFEINAGDKVAVIGPSGCGKSTLLDLIYGERLPDSGVVTYAGQVLEKHQTVTSVSYLLQESYVFDGLSLEDNIALGKPLDEGKLDQILNWVNLAFLRQQILYGDRLSGGEKQRLEIARGLYHESDLILADEVTSHLDKGNTNQISELLLSLPQTLVEIIHQYDDVRLANYDHVIDLSRKH